MKKSEMVRFFFEVRASLLVDGVVDEVDQGLEDAESLVGELHPIPFGELLERELAEFAVFLKA